MKSLIHSTNLCFVFGFPYNPEIFHLKIPYQQPPAPASIFRLSFPIIFPIWDPNLAHTLSMNV